MPKVAKCDRCGSTTVAWKKSQRTNKYYLVETFIDNEGDVVAPSNREFHSKYCPEDSRNGGEPLDHHTEQVKRYGAKDEPKPTPGNYAQEMALSISNRDDALRRVILVGSLAKEMPEVAAEVVEIWKRQGENTLAAMLEGALTGNAD